MSESVTRGHTCPQQCLINDCLSLVDVSMNISYVGGLISKCVYILLDIVISYLRTCCSSIADCTVVELRHNEGVTKPNEVCKISRVLMWVPWNSECTLIHQTQEQHWRLNHLGFFFFSQCVEQEDSLSFSPPLWGIPIYPAGVQEAFHIPLCAVGLAMYWL